MKISTGLTLPLAALFIVFLFMPAAAMAGTANCPVEPKANVTIASGDVFAGANCTLNTTGDVDSFVFKANSGDIWHLLLGGNNETHTGISICLALYDPNEKSIFSGCSDPFDNEYAVMIDQKLATTGSYTVVVTEATNGALNYGLSLERDYPSPSDGEKIALAQTLTGNLSPGEDSPAYTVASVVTGTYQVSATIPNGVSTGPDLCMNIYFPSGALAGSGCTDSFDKVYTTQVDFKPPDAGTSMVLLYEYGGDGSGTVGYSLEVSCLTGNCTPPPPSCTLTDTLTYNASTSVLTMDFTVGNTYATSWHTWLIHQNASLSLFSVAQPVTNPPVAVVKTTSLPKEGVVGVLSTLSTSTKGIVCSSFVKLSTGTP